MLTIIGQQQASGRGPKARKLEEGDGSGGGDEKALRARLGTFRELLPHRHQAEVVEKLLSHAAGVAYVESPRIRISSRAGTTIVLCGNLQANNEHVIAQTEAEKAGDKAKRVDLVKQVLDAYRKADWDLAKEEAILGKSSSTESPCSPARLFGRLKGTFAFVIWDVVSQRVVAARDQSGSEPLFWGASTFSEGLLFSTERALVEEEAADADQFPPGTFFVQTPGDGTKGTGVIKSLDFTECGEEEREEVLSGTLSDSEASEFDFDPAVKEQEGMWEPPLQTRGAKRLALKPPLLKEKKTQADGEESSSEEEVRRRLASCPSSPKALRSPRRAAARPWGGTGGAVSKSTPVSPRTAVRRAVSAAMTRASALLCRPASKEDLGSLNQIPAK